MELTQLHNITRAQVAALNKAKWTVETIATAPIFKLQRVPGIGRKIAEALIIEAQKIVNKMGYEESLFKEFHSKKAPQVPPVEKSVRVRRIEDSQK